MKVPFLGKVLESLQLGKGSSIFRKLKGPFLSQESSSLQLGKVSAIFRKVRKGKGKHSDPPHAESSKDSKEGGGALFDKFFETILLMGG